MPHPWNSSLSEKTTETFDEFPVMIGRSAKMFDLYKKIEKSADTKSTILILGESGTGKELLARAIHASSSRKNENLVVVDCAAMPANLLESELFGYVKGAFTGADRIKKGLCEEAHRGTLFLDEIGELPTDLQGKLLRMLQESTIRKIGETKSASVDIRIIAATNRNLEGEVKAGRFRQDLFYRLNVVPLYAPSLRERREDIPLLAQYFLEKYAKAYRRSVESFDPEVMEKMYHFDWPGNIRQLENLIEQMVVMCESSQITMSLFPDFLRDEKSESTSLHEQGEWDLKKVLTKIQAYTEERMIRKALRQTSNNKTKASGLLGISRRSLISKVQEYKIGVELT
jgi:transcriptional regulator with PAS, ATPase and Fis domain